MRTPVLIIYQHIALLTRPLPFRYFLLTPKLLPDLVYHPKMKVLVINVSPWIPGNLSLEKILKKKRKFLRQQAAVAAA